MITNATPVLNNIEDQKKKVRQHQQLLGVGLIDKLNKNGFVQLPSSNVGRKKNTFYKTQTPSVTSALT